MCIDLINIKTSAMSLTRSNAFHWSQGDFVSPHVSLFLITIRLTVLKISSTLSSVNIYFFALPSSDFWDFIVRHRHIFFFLAFLVIWLFECFSS